MVLEKSFASVIECKKKTVVNSKKPKAEAFE